MATVVELRQPLLAPHDAAWHAISTLSGLAGWQADQVQLLASRTAREVTPSVPADDALRLGDRITLKWALPGATANLEVVALMPERSIRLTGEMGTTELALLDGALHLRAHSPAVDKAGLAASWRLALCQLAHYLLRHPGRPRHVHWSSAKLKGSPELFHAYFTEEALLRQWFTSSGHIPKSGPFELVTFQKQQRLLGRVLHNPGAQDVLIALENQANSTLTFRTLPHSTDTETHVCAICLSSWGSVGDSLGLLEQHIRGSLQVLKRLCERRGAC